MQNNAHNASSSPDNTLARSAFALMFVGTLANIIALPFLFSAPTPSLDVVQSARSIFLVIYSIVLLVLVLFCWWLLRTPVERLAPLAEKVTRWFSHRIFVPAFTLFLIEVNFLAFVSLNQIAPGITGPLKFVLVCWSLAAFIALFIVNQKFIGEWLQRTQVIWTTIGLASAVFIAGFGLLFVNGQIILNGQLVEQLRGLSDYRAFPFYGDATPNLQLSRDFLTEMSRYKLRWQPYTYWVMEEKTGPYINVESNGLRRTSSFIGPNVPAPQIFLFGGSTMWGEGARDEYTIPSNVARRLNEAGKPAHVFNFGQTGYVSTQDMITFELQLIDGNIPNLAIFYGGFNDTLSGFGHHMAGLSLNEMNRAEDFNTGRLLDSGQVVLRPLNNVAPTTYDWSLAASMDGSPESIVERYLANVNLISTLADAYTVKVLFVWQPAPFYKIILTPEEQVLDAKQRADYPGLTDLYRQVDSLLRKEVENQSLRNFVIISDLFATTNEQIFIDIIHITENGNDLVAKAIVPVILETLEE